MKYWDTFINGTISYGYFLMDQVLYPSWHNYFYWVVGSCLSVFLWEKTFPWRKNQPLLRNEFWLDAFYIFWNYFLFSLILFNGLSMFFVELISDLFKKIGIQNLELLSMKNWPHWTVLVFVFFLRDFIQYFVHRLLHENRFLWRFHRVHHSTEEMGAGSLMRYHFVEHFVYRSVEYLPLAMIGVGLYDFFIVHIFTFLVGLICHANVYLPLGPFKYLFASPQMHYWHHIKQYPPAHKYGLNYGISLGLWDKLFGTSYWPNDEAKEKLGLPEDQKLEGGFFRQMTEPFNRKTN